jgi:hypothetical protein
MSELFFVGVPIALAILVAGRWIASAVRARPPALPPPGATGHKAVRDLEPGDEIFVAPMDGAWWTIELAKLGASQGWRRISVKERLPASGIIHLECVDGIQLAEASPGRRVWIRRALDR